MRRVLLASGAILALGAFWLLINIFAIRSHTLLTSGPGVDGPEISGIYTIREEHPSEWSTGPFSNQANPPRTTKVVQTTDTIDFLQLKDETWVSWKRFAIGEDLTWRDRTVAEYAHTPRNVGAAILPGIAKDRIEGWIRLVPDGHLEVEKVYWEKGLALFLFPFYDENRTRFVLEKAPGIVTNQD